MHSVKVDAKGRLSIPKQAREELAVKPGDVFYVQVEGSVLQFAKAPNPFDALAEEAEAEFRAGRTRNLHDLARELGIDLDAADE